MQISVYVLLYLTFDVNLLILIVDFRSIQCICSVVKMVRLQPVEVYLVAPGSRFLEHQGYLLNCSLARRARYDFNPGPISENEDLSNHRARAIARER